VYVPTNEAIKQAIKDGIIRPWETDGEVVGINQLGTAAEQQAAMVKLERFLRYHFQDNSVFVDNFAQERLFQSATIKTDNNPSFFGTFRNKYYKIGITAAPGNLVLKTEKGETVQVDTSKGLYNILTRDFVFNNRPSNFKNPDGTGAGQDYATTSIITSSTAVIHQINKVLNFQ
jgi:hypothetical protein